MTVGRFLQTSGMLSTKWVQGPLPCQVMVNRSRIVSTGRLSMFSRYQGRRTRNVKSSALMNELRILQRHIKKEAILISKCIQAFKICFATCSYLYVEYS